MATTALASLLIFGGTGTAQATPSYAYASLGFTNFQLTGIVDSHGNALPGVTINSVAVTMTDGANYPGYPSAGTTSFGDLATGVDAPGAYSGPGPATGPNIFTPALQMSSGTRSDGLISGALASGATSNLVAEGRLTQGLSSAGSQAGSSTTIRATFTTTSSLTVGLLGSAIAQVMASVGQVGDSASAQIFAQFTVFDATTNTYVNICKTSDPTDCSQFLTPTELNISAATTDPSTSPSVTSSLTDFSYFANLTADHTYQVTLQDQVTEILSTVPEPASMAVLGMGILGLAGVVRRRKHR
ncbi:MAG TPA: PEP-CTERM sorting domain-containing protein [Rhodopila sp.]|nr:PEP-CTERM sorting domain-containing protein [Rhodopila sp.]